MGVREAEGTPSWHHKSWIQTPHPPPDPHPHKHTSKHTNTKALTGHTFHTGGITAHTEPGDSRTSGGTASPTPGAKGVFVTKKHAKTQAHTQKHTHNLSALKRESWPERTETQRWISISPKQLAEGFIHFNI